MHGRIDSQIERIEEGEKIRAEGCAARLQLPETERRSRKRSSCEKEGKVFWPETVSKGSQGDDGPEVQSLPRRKV